MAGWQERVELVEAALGTDVFKQQLKTWAGEKQSNRLTLADLWEDGELGAEFRNFWEQPPHVDCLREAMIITAIEDIMETLAGPFVATMCPDLVTLQQAALLSAQTLQGLAEGLEEPGAISISESETAGDTLYQRALDIMLRTREGQENEAPLFDRHQVEQGIADAALSNGPFVLHSLLLVRSCVLLQFTLDLWMIWDTNKDSFGEEDVATEL